jgi:hypothetical protein
MSHPVLIDEKPADQVHNGKDGEHLSKTGPEASCAIDDIGADKDKDKVQRNAQALKNFHVPFDLFRCDQSVFHAPVLNILMIQEHHVYCTVSDTDSADKHQQSSQQNSFYDNFNDHHPFLR